MPSLRSLVLLLLLLAFGAGVAVAAEVDHALVLLDLQTPQAQDFLRLHPGLDIASAKPGVEVQIVADAADLALIRASGLEHRVLIEHLEQFYAARNTAKDLSFGLWHTYAEAGAFLDSLHMLYPQVVSEKWSIGQTHQLRDIWCIRVSDNPDVDEDEPEMLIDGMHHAREIMASEFCLMFPEYLAQNYGTDPEITYLLDNRELYIVPIVNPDGVVYNQQTDPSGRRHVAQEPAQQRWQLRRGPQPQLPVPLG